MYLEVLEVQYHAVGTDRYAPRGPIINDWSARYKGQEKAVAQQYEDFEVKTKLLKHSKSVLKSNN